MDKMDIILWILGTGFAFTFALLLTTWNNLSTRIDKLDEKLSDRIDKLDEKLSNRIDKLDEKVTDIDRRLCRLEGAFASKDCCMIKDDRQFKKAAD